MLPVPDAATPTAWGAGSQDAALQARPEQPMQPGPTPLAPAALPAPRGSAETPVEVTVKARSKADKLRESAQAVLVLETAEAKKQTSDLGEVLARTQSVGLRRAGGLGSFTRFSLNGMTDDQIRFFLNGIPLELAGYTFGIANLSLDLIDQIEIYRGVVPVSFGADALGGAVNLVVEDDVRGTHGMVSYQGGSFNTHRAVLRMRHLHRPSGLFVHAGGFFDYTDNDYPIDVEVSDASGRPTPARAYRFHDAYRASGGYLETGFVNRPWAKRLLLRTFATGSFKELQHNVNMTVPYGDVENGERAVGGTLRYAHVLPGKVSVDAVGGYTYGRASFEDTGQCVYDWFGQCILERARAGEIEPASDQRVWDHTGFARASFSWRIRPAHALQASLAPTYVTRTGDDRRQTTSDPLNAEHELFSFVAGLGYEANLLAERLENVAFVKNYLQLLDSEEWLQGGILRQRDRNTHRVGLGNALRYRFLDWLYAKASYEWATRLPRTDEVFGDGLAVRANLELRPEVSHNANLQLSIDDRATRAGAWRLELNGFLRESRELIALFPKGPFFTYQNISGARSLGLEAGAGWTSKGGYLELDGNVTHMSFRNTSGDGTFGAFEGDRIPNRPYLFANGIARLRFRGVAARRDELSWVWITRYVHEFFRSWESAGLRDFKDVVPTQVVHSLALIYRVEGDPIALTFAAELQNLTDARAFDFFGVQRPGRAIQFKARAEF